MITVTPTTFAAHHMAFVVLGAGFTPATFAALLVLTLAARLFGRIAAALGAYLWAHVARVIVLVATLGIVELHVSKRSFSRDIARAFFGGWAPRYVVHGR